MTTELLGGLGRSLASVLLSCLCWLGSAHADESGTCLPGLQGLTALQQGKFTLTRQGCEDAPSDLALTESRPLADATLLTQTSVLINTSSTNVAMPLAPSMGKASAVAGTRAMALAPQVDMVALRHDIDPLLLHAIAFVESRHNAQAVSHAGAMGLMQVMPATARRFGVASPSALHQVSTNLEVSAVYLKTLQQRFGNDLKLVLAAYNAGEGAVERYGRRIPPYAETRAYVSKVLAQYDALRAAAGRSLRTVHHPV